jgi:hypothetical protein
VRTAYILLWGIIIGVFISRWLYGPEAAERGERWGKATREFFTGPTPKGGRE